MADNFDMKKFLVENKLGPYSKLPEELESEGRIKSKTNKILDGDEADDNKHYSEEEIQKKIEDAFGKDSKSSNKYITHEKDESGDEYDLLNQEVVEAFLKSVIDPEEIASVDDFMSDSEGYDESSSYFFDGDISNPSEKDVEDWVTMEMSYYLTSQPDEFPFKDEKNDDVKINRGSTSDGHPDDTSMPAWMNEEENNPQDYPVKREPTGKFKDKSISIKGADGEGIPDGDYEIIGKGKEDNSTLLKDKKGQEHEIDNDFLTKTGYWKNGSHSVEKNTKPRMNEEENNEVFEPDYSEGEYAADKFERALRDYIEHIKRSDIGIEIEELRDQIEQKVNSIIIKHAQSNHKNKQFDSVNEDTMNVNFADDDYSESMALKLVNALLKKGLDHDKIKLIAKAMLKTPSLNETLEPHAFERMDQLSNEKAKLAMIKAAEILMRDLTDEGFEVEEVREFFTQLISNDI